jgi:cell division protein FtsB
MISNHTLADSMLKDAAPLFQFPLQCAQDQYIEQLKLSCSASPSQLLERTQQIHTLRQDRPFLEQQMHELRTLQQDEQVLRNRIVSDTTKAAEGQIFWTGIHTRCLNTIPYCITFMVFCKIYLFPALGLLSPILLFIAPYILLRTMFDGGANMPLDVYITLMKQMVLGIQPGQQMTLKQVGQLVWMVLSLGQGMVQPFFTAYHTSTLDSTVLARANALHRIAAKTQELQTYFQERWLLNHTVLIVPEIPVEAHEAAAWMDDEPLGLKIIWKLLGQMTVSLTIAADTRWHPVPWEATENAEFELDGFADLAIESSKAVRSTLTLDHHGILTGPNRGGKSSNLRGILQQVLLGQTFGCTFMCTGTWRPFGYIGTRLKSYDSAGKESLFEMEVRHAATMLRKIQSSNTHALLLIDELFHSTNPPDAETAAILFLEQLWELPHVKSIVSTHIFRLCREPPVMVVPLCCPAVIEEDGKVAYTYELCPGICTTSSVQEVLEEAGMF